MFFVILYSKYPHRRPLGINTLTEDHLETGVLTGFVHNVSPIKQNDRDVKWFDCQLQTERGVVRAVCFQPSPSTQNLYNQVAQDKSPVKISNFEKGKKREGRPVDVVISKRTRVVVVISKRTRVEEVRSGVKFERLNLLATTKATNIGSLKDDQLVSVTALLSNFKPVREVTRRGTNEKVSLLECQASDPTGSVKFTVWERFLKSVSPGTRYVLDSVRLSKDNGNPSLSTTQRSACAIKPCDPFPGLEPPEDLPSTVHTKRMEVLGVVSTSSFNSCHNCNKKIVIPAEKKCGEMSE